jgi:hypothetical protein
MDRRPAIEASLRYATCLVATLALAAGRTRVRGDEGGPPRDAFSSFGPALQDGARLLAANLRSPVAAAALAEGVRRVRVADPDAGGVRVAREYGPPGSRALLLPDGQIVWTERPVYTDAPFVAEPREAVRDRLLAGPYAGFRAEVTAHYVVFSKSSPAFAAASARLLETLYEGLLQRFRDRGFDVRDAEFPLVAVIFATEAEFRAHRDVAPDVQAYYDVLSNRIFFYETAERAADDPQAAALRQPQTVAHEGTHQILQNIGLQPRLADWPLWLVEGMAELAASTQTVDGAWAGMSQVNPFHVATLEDLLDAQWMRRAPDAGGPPAHDWRRSLVEYLSRRDHLTPTDYALAWTLTHYLANRRTDAFLAFIREMSAREPGVDHSDEDDLALFRKHFGPAPERLDRAIHQHVQKLRERVPLTYYAVTFEQSLPDGMVRRGTLVSRSPSLIREWIEQRMPDPRGGPYRWHAMPFRERVHAVHFAEEWLRTR